MRVRFTKMHGAGNDYIYVDTTRYPIPDPEKTAIIWSAYHTGIGSDGLVLIGRSQTGNFSMRIFNADGSEATMCGNASRCIGKYLYEKGLTNKKEIALETLSGIKVLKLQVVEDKVASVTVDMGIPDEIRLIDFKEEYPFNATALSIGNPHLVIFVDNIDNIDLSSIGPKLENHPLFPGRINVEFAQILHNGQIRMRVWERGSGITMACGTGACATAVAAAYNGMADRKSNILMDGGALTIEWNSETNHVLMTGSATNVFEGELDLDL